MFSKTKKNRKLKDAPVLFRVGKVKNTHKKIGNREYTHPFTIKACKLQKQDNQTHAILAECRLENGLDHIFSLHV